jgi:hypothetical protein
MFPTTFNTSTPLQNAAPSCDWVGEGAAVHVSDASLASATLEPCVLSTIIVITRELAKRSSPAAESAVRKILLDSVAFNLDRVFLDPNYTAVANTRPASITNGSATQSSTGSTAAQISSDLAALASQLGTWKDVCWLTRPRTFAFLAATVPGTADLRWPATLPDGFSHFRNGSERSTNRTGGLECHPPRRRRPGGNHSQPECRAGHDRQSGSPPQPVWSPCSSATTLHTKSFGKSRGSEPAHRDGE